MSRRSAMLVTLLAPVALAAAANRPGSDAPAAQLGDLRAAGTVQLRTSCRPEAQASFDRATALLHSFSYEEARRGFAEVEAQDPGCAMAHWGVAMTLWHPIWTPPTPEEKEAGRKAIERARAIGGRTDVERGLIGALSAYYADPPADAAVTGGEAGQSCHGLTGGADHAARALAYEQAMGRLYVEHPGDVEVAAFYALALLERGKAREALAEYEGCLKVNPGRLNGLYGAGSAAERAGEREVARRHYEALAAMVAKDATRPEVASARAFLAEAARPADGRRARASGTTGP